MTFYRLQWRVWVFDNLFEWYFDRQIITAIFVLVIWNYWLIDMSLAPNMTQTKQHCHGWSLSYQDTLYLHDRTPCILSAQFPGLSSSLLFWLISLCNVQCLLDKETLIMDLNSEYWGWSLVPQINTISIFVISIKVPLTGWNLPNLLILLHQKYRVFWKQFLNQLLMTYLLREACDFKYWSFENHF